MTKFADLHIHTHFSDGTSSPQEVVNEAVAAGLSCISITDHDTIDGVAPTCAIAQSLNLEIIAGIELSSEISGKDIHILGYLMDSHDSVFQEQLKKMQNIRKERIKLMIEKLKAHGIGNIVASEVFALTQSHSVGRPHLAAILKQKGWVASIPEAFDKYIAEGRSAYVAKFKQSPQEAIALIRRAGGVAVLAHPMVNNRDEIIPSLVEAGLQGIEVYYPNCSQTITKFYEGIAKKYNLVTTGGCDGHGKARPNTYIGKIKVPYEAVEKLKSVKGK